MSDLSYNNKGLFTTFLANTPEGVKLWNQMHEQHGDAILTIHLPSVLRQIRKAGYSVSKSKPVKQSDDKLLNALFS